MTDPTNLPQSSQASSQTWSALSEGLKRSLLASASNEIAAAPGLLAECETALPGLRWEALRSAERGEIIHVLSQRFAVYPQPDRTEGEWGAWWADYVNALDDLPPSAIEAAMAAYVKAPDSEFFPKPGRIRDLARTVPNRMASAYQTALWAIRQAQGTAQQIEPPKPVEPATEDQRQQVRTMAASFNRIMDEQPRRQKPALPPVSGPVDERGLTQAMREHMANRGDQR